MKSEPGSGLILTIGGRRYWLNPARLLTADDRPAANPPAPAQLTDSRLRDLAEQLGLASGAPSEV